MPIAYIGLGSNLGIREQYLAAARKLIAESAGKLIAESSILETKAVDFTDQPDFLNQVIKIETELDPVQLIEELKRIETAIGRSKTFNKGPREIDLDILLYDDIILNSDRLVIPHPAIVHRDFVMRHLVQIEPGLCDPVSGSMYREMAGRGRQ